MNTKRLAKAGALSASILALSTAAACGSTPAQPASPPAATTPAVPIQQPTTTPSTATPTQKPTPTTTPSLPIPMPMPPWHTPSPWQPARIVLSRVAYAWHWPNDVARPGGVTHPAAVPPVPELIRIGAGDHPAEPGEHAYNRITFAFTTGFPSYRFQFVDRLIADPIGNTVPLAGDGVLQIVFNVAQAHTASGASTIVWQPSRHLGLDRMVDYARSGDFEGHLSYGVGIDAPVAHANPQFAVRAYEVESVTPGGRHLYTVAIDVDAS